MKGHITAVQTQSSCPCSRCTRQPAASTPPVSFLQAGCPSHTAPLMPLPLTVSCFSKIQIGFTFLVPAHPGSPGQRAVKRVCVDALPTTDRHAHHSTPLLYRRRSNKMPSSTGDLTSGRMQPRGGHQCRVPLKTGGPARDCVRPLQGTSSSEESPSQHRTSAAARVSTRS